MIVMKIHFLNKERLKRSVFVLCLGSMLGANTFVHGLNVREGEELEKSLEEMTLDEKLKMRGGVHIYFQNKEYLNMDKDFISFYDDEKVCYGLVYSNHDDYVITFVPGKYNFYIQSLDCYGSFEIRSAGEILDLDIDYQNRCYEMSDENHYLGKSRRKVNGDY